MSDKTTNDQDNATESPTIRKLEQTKKDGNYIESRDVNSFLIISSFIISIFWITPFFIEDIILSMKILFEHIYNMEDAQVILKIIIEKVTSLLNRIFISLVSATIISYIIQRGGFFIKPHKLKLNLSNISWFKGFNKIFGSINFLRTIKLVITIIILIVSTLILVKINFNSIIILSMLDLNSILFFFNNILQNFLFFSVIITGLIAFFDYIYQRYNYFKKLKMSNYDIKKEYELSEVNPNIRNQQKLLLKSILKDGAQKSNNLDHKINDKL